MKLQMIFLTMFVALLLWGCAPTMERLDSVQSSAQKLIEGNDEALQSSAMESQPSAKADQNQITREGAEQIALQDAGLTREQVSRLRTELEHEDGRRRYEITFHWDGREYQYDISADTGEILSYDRER